MHKINQAVGSLYEHKDAGRIHRFHNLILLKQLQSALHYADDKRHLGLHSCSTLNFMLCSESNLISELL